MTITAPAAQIPARSTQIVTSAKCLEVGDVILAKSETIPGGTVLSTPGGLVLNVESDGNGVVSVCLGGENGEDRWVAMYALLVLDVVRPWPAA